MVKFRTLEKQKRNLVIGSTIIKVNIEHSERVTKNFLRNFLTLTVVWMVTVKSLNNAKTHEQMKERETFWQHKLKTFYRIGLNEKKEYYINIGAFSDL